MSKLIYEIQEVWPKSIVDFGMEKPSNPIIRFINWFEKKAIERLGAVLSPLRNIHLYLDKKGCADKEIIILPNGIFSFLDVPFNVYNKERVDGEAILISSGLFDGHFLEDWQSLWMSRM